MQIQPYLFFDGCCEQALQYYQQALDAEVISLLRYEDNPDPIPADAQEPGHTVPPGWETKIMNASFRIGETLLMASDGFGNDRVEGGAKGFALALNVLEASQADRYFASLAEGGKVDMPLGKTFWSPRFGALTDKFSVSWLINTLELSQK